MKIKNIFNWRLKLVQKGYDLGWEHGFEAGQVEKSHEILEVLAHNIESINWLREEPLEVRDIIPMVKKSQEEERVEVTWQ